MMKLYPIKKCQARADQLLAAHKHANIYQQFNCAGCGAKQTMDMPNAFFTHGICDVCGAQTNIEKDGCNYAVQFAIGPIGRLAK